MPRTIQLTLPSNQADELIADMQNIDGVIGLRVQRGVSIRPPGDVVYVEVTNRSLHPLMRLLAERGIGHDSSTFITTSVPASVVSSPFIKAITRDTSDATWEEMEAMLGRESNMTGNTLVLMGVCGLFAAVGISTNALHIVIAAMLIAPGFEPITRIGLGAAARSATWRRGLSDTVKGYGVLILAAAATTLVLQALGKDPLHGESTYLPAGVLISYWTKITLSSLLATAFASVAGALLVATNRSVLTGGVMIALALIPAAAIIGMGIVAGDPMISGRALLRLVIEITLVGTFSTLVFLWKQKRLQRREMLL